MSTAVSDTSAATWAVAVVLATVRTRGFRRCCQAAGGNAPTFDLHHRLALRRRRTTTLTRPAALIVVGGGLVPRIRHVGTNVGRGGHGGSCCSGGFVRCCQAVGGEQRGAGSLNRAVASSSKSKDKTHPSGGDERGDDGAPQTGVHTRGSPVTHFRNSPAVYGMVDA